MQRRIIYFLTITVLFFGANFLVAHIASQTNPFSLRQMLNAVAAVKEGRITQSKIISDIRKRKVDFPLTKENEKSLRDEGANNEIIEAIRQNSPPISKPTATPVQTPTSSNNSNALKNSIGMEFVKIPAGTFMMGSPTSEKDSQSDEKPQHKVTISKDFYLGKYEVTQGQWEAVMGNNPSKFSSCGDDCPVEQVSWEDVQEFIKKLNAKDSGTYRLPTEAEWEYAARAGTTTAFAFGDNLSSSQANFNGNAPAPHGNGAKGKYLEKTVEVGSYQPNAWGLYDMHGNVREWCADWYGKDYYASSSSVDPTGPSSGSDRVFRGGSYGDDAVYLRSAFRYFNSPSNRNFGLGFRLVRTQ